jgi:hypothetical protein
VWFIRLLPKVSDTAFFSGQRSGVALFSTDKNIRSVSFSLVAGADSKS